MKYIFLDFDGVLLPTLYEQFLITFEKISKSNIKAKDQFGYFFHPDCINNLNKLLDHDDNKRLIITSTWKNDMMFDDIINMLVNRGFNVDGISISKTINIKPDKRGLEIQDYIDRYINLNNDKYIIIDDMGENFFLENQKPFLIKCDEKYGFGYKELSKSIELLY